MSEQEKPQKFSALGDIVREQLTRLGGGRFETISAIEKIWPSVAGELMARKTRVLSFKNGCLNIAAESAAWAQELLLQKGMIAAQLNRQLPDSLAKILEIRCSVGL